MKARTSLPALVLLGTLASSGCFGDLDAVSGATVPMTSQVTDWRDEVIYQLLVDRFADGDTANDHRVDRSALGRYQGGDWQGVIDHMDYLDALGVTTLWISPIIRNVDTDAGFDGYHGYWASDLTRLNPHFGDLGTLRRLVQTAHQHHIKVILDIVTNHMGQMFYYDINNNGRPDENIGGSGVPPAPGAPNLDPNANPAHDRQFQDPGSTTSDLWRNSEYDPDFNVLGPVQAFTSLGPAGDAPVIFLNMPEIFRTPPAVTDFTSSFTGQTWNQAILASPLGYHRRGRTVVYHNNGDTHQPDDQVRLGDFPGGLKDVATEDPRVRTLMIEAYWRWVELTDLDGFRIDTLKHVEHEFWTTFATGIRQRAMRAGKRNFLLFGEAFDGDDALVGSFTNPNEMDSVFYFPQKFRVFDNIFQCGAGRTRDVETLYTDRVQHYSNAPQALGVTAGGAGTSPRQLLVNFMDNHDVSRFLYGMNPTTVADIRAGGTDCTSGLVDHSSPESIARDTQRLRTRLHAALAYLLTEDGIPCIYYGTEQDFRGGNDPSNRERLWETGFPTTGQPRSEGGVTTFAWIQQLIHLRRTYSALRRGTFAVAWATDHTAAEPDVGMLAFERQDGPNYALVVIHAHDGSGQTNTGDSPMAVHLPPGTVLDNVLSPTARSVTVGPSRNGDANGTLTVSLDAWQSAVFVPHAQRQQ